MRLLEYGAHVDDRVDILALPRIFPQRRLRILAEKIAQAANGGARGRRIARSGKGEDAKAAVRLDDMAEVHRLGIGETDDRRGMEARPDDETLQRDAGGRLPPVRIDGV